MKTDRRILRTRQLLRDSLIALILEKGYDAVTVQDITDRANLGRIGFATISSVCHDHRAGDRALALAHQCEIPGRGPHDSFLDSALDVRLAGRVPG